MENIEQKEVKKIMSYKEKYNLLHEAASKHIIKQLSTNDFAEKLYEIDEAWCSSNWHNVQLHLNPNGNWFKKVAPFNKIIYLFPY